MSAKVELLQQGYPPFQEPRPPELFFDLVRDPLERRNVAGDPAYAPTLHDLRTRLWRWMESTADPLLDGDIPVPAGATVKPSDQ